jgi:hypothetical protein
VAGGKLIVGGNPDRYALLIGTDGTNTVLVTFGSDDGIVAGIPLTAQNGYVEVTEIHHGTGVQQAFTIRNGGGANATVAWTEFIKGS